MRSAAGPLSSSWDSPGPRANKRTPAPPEGRSLRPIGKPDGRSSLFSIPVHPASQVVGGHWCRYVVPLHKIAVHRVEHIERAFGFDALRGHGKSKPMAKVDRGRHD